MPSSTPPCSHFGTWVARMSTSPAGLSTTTDRTVSERGMIVASFGQKPVRPSKADERRAYADATARDSNRCVKCDAFGIERDHRKNRSQGGWTTVANLQGLCPPCHVWKTQNPTAALLEGFAVPSWARPELWPGWREGVGWVVYFDAPNEAGEWWRPITETVADMLMDGRDVR